MQEVNEGIYDTHTPYDRKNDVAVVFLMGLLLPPIVYPIYHRHPSATAEVLMQIANAFAFMIAVASASYILYCWYYQLWRFPQQQVLLIQAPKGSSEVFRSVAIFAIGPYAIVAAITMISNFVDAFNPAPSRHLKWLPFFPLVFKITELFETVVIVWALAKIMFVVRIRVPSNVQVALVILSWYHFSCFVADTLDVWDVVAREQISNNIMVTSYSSFRLMSAIILRLFVEIVR